MSLRMNVRNFLLPMRIPEVQRELELSLERDDTERAGYVEEFLRELEAEFNGGEPFASCQGCYCSPCECLPDDCNCDPN